MVNLPKPPIDEEPDPLEELVESTKPYLSQEVVNKIILNGDLSKLSESDKAAFYVYRCKMLGLDPASKPFDLLKLQGKEVLYANKSCAANLRALHKISTEVIGEQEWNGLYIVRARAWYPDGRQHTDEGFATLTNLSGDALGNARLKAMTKATRRAILHLCGLGELDESEVETIPGATKVSAIQEARAILIPKQAPTGSDSIKVVDIKGADANTDTVEVLDESNRVWRFKGADAQKVAFEAVGKGTSILIDFTVENGEYVVRNAKG